VIPDKTDPVAVPWSTGFENRFCDYTELASFCYANAPATYGLVTSPVHSGRFAAAFSVESADPVGFQTRCVRQGVLPTDAYYGAWYYIPAFATVSGNWNLLHFAGGDDLSTTGGITGFLDVSLLSANGALQLALFGPNHVRLDNPPNTTPVPIGAWFRIQLRLKRAAGMTGEAALYQDGQQLCDATNVVTDSSSLGQWYVGNFANNSALTPLDSTLYVDDVTISNAL
jgi:hypothetical protein